MRRECEFGEDKEEEEEGAAQEATAARAWRPSLCPRQARARKDGVHDAVRLRLHATRPGVSRSLAHDGQARRARHECDAPIPQSQRWPMSTQARARMDSAAPARPIRPPPRVASARHAHLRTSAHHERHSGACSCALRHAIAGARRTKHVPRVRVRKAQGVGRAAGTAPHRERGCATGVAWNRIELPGPKARHTRCAGAVGRAARA